MRTFFCLPSDPELNDRLSSIVSDLRARIHTRVSWVTKGNYHVTVRFLGEIDPMLTLDLERMVRPLAEETPPFDLLIDRVGAFPSPSRARVIWAGGKAPAEFIKLVTEVNKGLSELGFPPEREDPIAHITLGRVKGRPDPTLTELLSEVQETPNWVLRVDRIVLMESRLTPHGPIYNPLFTIPLSGGKDAV